MQITCEFLPKLASLRASHAVTLLPPPFPPHQVCSPPETKNIPRQKKKNKYDEGESEISSFKASSILEKGMKSTVADCALIFENSLRGFLCQSDLQEETKLLVTLDTLVRERKFVKEREE